MAAVRYFVADLDRSIRFYQEAFGFEEKERWGPAFAIVHRDDLDLWLSGPKTSAAVPMPDGRTPEPGGWNRIVITVEDIQATVAKLRDLSTVFRNDVITGPGGSQVLIEDPDGNPIEVFQPRD
jgi:catechol 2,3-dioxygenase-like lactoylglutathione lyase family enzyme